ncbi:MAG: cytochrome C, partial [Ignavibacteriae bacterium HGW-Ignavibacteriae-3]
MKIKLFPLLLIGLVLPGYLYAQSSCVDCHNKINPNIVSDWKLSKHSVNEIGCEICHGTDHKNSNDYSKAVLPTPETCNSCHDAQVEQYKKGKHAAAWAAMNAMPTTHMLPLALTDGMKGCGSCHKIGIKDEVTIKKLKNEGSVFGH